VQFCKNLCLFISKTHISAIQIMTLFFAFRMYNQQQQQFGRQNVQAQPGQMIMQQQGMPQGGKIGNKFLMR
jgi:hypothetical protein